MCSLRRATAKRRMQFGTANIATPENQDTESDGEDGHETAETNNLQDSGAVARAFRIVFKAEQQQMIDGRADLARGSVDQAETHVARWIFHAVKISRDAPVGHEQHDTAGVRENIPVRVKRVAKVCGFGEGVNRFFRTG